MTTYRATQTGDGTITRYTPSGPLPEYEAFVRLARKIVGGAARWDFNSRLSPGPPPQNRVINQVGVQYFELIDSTGGTDRGIGTYLLGIDHD